MRRRDEEHACGTGGIGDILQILMAYGIYVNETEEVLL
jgi:hypothetical protein